MRFEHWSPECQTSCNQAATRLQLPLEKKWFVPSFSHEHCSICLCHIFCLPKETGTKMTLSYGCACQAVCSQFVALAFEGKAEQKHGSGLLPFDIVGYCLAILTIPKPILVWKPCHCGCFFTSDLLKSCLLSQKKGLVNSLLGRC